MGPQYPHPSRSYVTVTPAFGVGGRVETGGFLELIAQPIELNFDSVGNPVLKGNMQNGSGAINT